MMSNDKDKKKESLGQECLSCNKCDCGCGCGKRSNLDCTNWLADIPGNDFDIVEVQFKNTRKGFYRNSAHIPLEVGDMVAVEANPGHDIGRVSMMGRLVKLQMKKANLKPNVEILRVFRKAKASDLERFEQAKAKEVDTMIRSRQIALDLKLKMKIGDVEYQGDGNKAIFYYIADERVDFRQLIKVLADVFKIRVEMKQIGARQEAGRIGGIGPCGRPLCCATWMTNFVSVATSAARYQDISLNPQKLAGQCAKLKCCINFEVDDYVEATKQLPSRDVPLETKDNIYYHFKTDIFKKKITYSTDKHIPANLVTISADRVFEVIEMNKQGEKPDKLEGDDGRKPEIKAFGDLLGQDSISRFDKKKKKKSKGSKGGNKDKDKEARDKRAAGEKKERGDEQQQREPRQKQQRGKNRPPRQGEPSEGGKPKAEQASQQPRGEQRQQGRQRQQRRQGGQRRGGDNNRKENNASASNSQEK
ncbi:MAG: regulatory iron-sulfur-containing complex subunit RicT [Bacteroidales bacterium]|nr:regulatory iron-sulfur-containing complex subunit RicT [Bacteroidales bacterium]